MSDHEAENDQQATADRVHDELWRHLDWSFWGTGMADAFREPLADTMIAAITPEQRQQANDLITWWRTRRQFVGRDKYEEQKAEIEQLQAENERLWAAVEEMALPACHYNAEYARQAIANLRAAASDTAIDTPQHAAVCPRCEGGKADPEDQGDYDHAVHMRNPSTRRPCSECGGTGLPTTEETRRAHAEGEHAFCGTDCEEEFPTEELRAAILARAIPGAAGMLDELLRRPVRPRGSLSARMPITLPRVPGAGPPPDRPPPCRARCHAGRGTRTRRGTHVRRFVQLPVLQH